MVYNKIMITDQVDSIKFPVIGRADENHGTAGVKRDILVGGDFCWQKYNPDPLDSCRMK